MCFVDMFSMLFKEEGLDKDYTKVTDMRRSEHSGAVDGEREAMGEFGMQLGTNDDVLCFAIV